MESLFIKLLGEHGTAVGLSGGGLVFLFMLHKQALAKITDMVVSNNKQNEILEKLSVKLSILTVNDATQDTKLTAIDDEIMKLREFKHSANNTLQNHGARIRNLEKGK